MFPNSPVKSLGLHAVPFLPRKGEAVLDRQGSNRRYSGKELRFTYRTCLICSMASFSARVSELPLRTAVSVACVWLSNDDA
jgi:hypothetical protein